MTQMARYEVTIRVRVPSGEASRWSLEEVLTDPPTMYASNSSSRLSSELAWPPSTNVEFPLTIRQTLQRISKTPKWATVELELFSRSLNATRTTHSLGKQIETI